MLGQRPSRQTCKHLGMGNRASEQLCAWARRICSNVGKAVLPQLERQARGLQQAASLVGRLLCLRTGGALSRVSCLACRDM